MFGGLFTEIRYVQTWSVTNIDRGLSQLEQTFLQLPPLGLVQIGDSICDITFGICMTIEKPFRYILGGHFKRIVHHWYMHVHSHINGYI